jgi:hypothetical protein
MIEVDHLIVCTDVGASEADGLVTFGLTEGEPNVHPGQGTANRRFFFHNAFLELLWVSDPAEAQSELVLPTQLWPRWSQRRSGPSPIGVVLRSTHPDAEDVPFSGWEYKPPYWPYPRGLYIREGVPLSEPWWVYLGFGRRYDDPGRLRRQPLDHGVGFREITQVRITGPAVDSRSTPASLAPGTVTLEPGPEHLLEITFDGGAQQRNEDFRPVMPLVFVW